MPHTIVEYSKNLGPEADIPGMMQKLAARMRDTGGVFPVGGIRVRAIAYDDYVVADGDPENRFVVVTFKLAQGRAPDFLKAFFDGVFEMLQAHFSDIHARHPFSLAVYVEDIAEGSGYRWNNIHARLKAKAAAAAE